jgi:predicted site-specific integrase-resolvase
MQQYRNLKNEETIQAVRERRELESIYTFEEAAHDLRVSRATVSTYVRSGRATPRYIGAENGRMYFDHAEIVRLRAMLDERRG